MKHLPGITNLVFKIIIIILFIILLFYNFDEEYALVQSFVRFLCRACVGLGD